MVSIFVINIIKNIPELLVPLLKIIAKRTMRKEGDTLIIHPFRDMDIFINDQMDLIPYTTNSEIDGTVSDYMELIVQFSFLCFFGLAFPSSFILAWVNNVFEIQVDKLKLVYVSRRPVRDKLMSQSLLSIEKLTLFILYRSQPVQRRSERG